MGAPTGGTALTVKLSKKHRKPFLVVDLARGGDPTAVRKGPSFDTQGQRKPNDLWDPRIDKGPVKEPVRLAVDHIPF